MMIILMMMVMMMMMMYLVGAIVGAIEGNNAVGARVGEVVGFGCPSTTKTIDSSNINNNIIFRNTYMSYNHQIFTLETHT